MKPIIVVAIGSNFVIGKNGDLPWRGKLPADLHHFRDLTMGNTVIMGRKTWESIPGKYRPLPGRLNIVITRQEGYNAPGAMVCYSLKEVLETCSKNIMYIIGGSEIFKESLAFVDEIRLTLIHQEFDGDVRFPLDMREWVVKEQQDHSPHDRNRYRYSFITLKRRGT